MNPSGKCSGGIFCQIGKIRMRFALMQICQCVLPSQSFASQMPALPKGEPRSQCGLYIWRIRKTLIQTCSRAAPSVTACAAPPSSERKAFVLHNLTCLSLWERCRAVTERAGSLVRELDCRFAARLREQPTSPDESGYLLYEFVRVSPSQSFASQMPALPKGEPRSRCGLYI